MDGVIIAVVSLVLGLVVGGLMVGYATAKYAGGAMGRTIRRELSAGHITQEQARQLAEVER